MNATQAMRDLRALHRPGTADMATALALTRAASRADWDALLSLVRGVGADDDMLGVAVWLALIGGGAVSQRTDADAYLNLLADAERAHA